MHGQWVQMNIITDVRLISGSRLACRVAAKGRLGEARACRRASVCRQLGAHRAPWEHLAPPCKFRLSASRFSPRLALLPPSWLQDMGFSLFD